MTKKQPIPGSGRFQWNSGGWFGGQIGSTIWLLPTGSILLFEHPSLGIIWLSIFTAINAIGFWMWNRRDRLDPYRSIQWLFLACGIGGLLAVASFNFLQSNAGLPAIEMNGWRLRRVGLGPESLRLAYFFFILGIPTMMGWFALLEVGSRKARAKFESGQAIAIASNRQPRDQP